MGLGPRISVRFQEVSEGGVSLTITADGNQLFWLQRIKLM